jgi:dihydrodipicolinate synthase/N-acetylneuraminate lyase
MSAPELEPRILAALHAGVAIPAHPLALDADRHLDERRQRALTRYYAAAGAGGIAVGVHTTQFAIRDPGVDLLRPVMELAAETLQDCETRGGDPLIRFAGVCGQTPQAMREAGLASDLGYHIGLLSLAALPAASDDELIAHSESIAQVIPVCGFYLQPSVGGRVLSHEFWRRFAEIEGVVAIKIAPFNRYHTLDVLRAVARADRGDDIALYTGNDDHIVGDLCTEYRFGSKRRRFAGGLLGHWAVWTHRAVELLARTKACDAAPNPSLLAVGNAVTDCNAAFFDARNGFRGCIAGLHEVLRRQGLLAGLWCLDPSEGLSPGQLAEIDRVYAAYPELNDDAFVAEHLDEWLA